MTVMNQLVDSLLDIVVGNKWVGYESEIRFLYEG